MDAPSASVSFPKRSTLTLKRPLSILDMVSCLSPVISASADWDIPLFVLNSAILPPILSLISMPLRIPRS